jgi:hypothetical protein
MPPYNQQVGLECAYRCRHYRLGRSGIDEDLCCRADISLECVDAELCLRHSVMGEFLS